eukprot:652376-Rhodomonas_salina.14
MPETVLPHTAHTHEVTQAGSGTIPPYTAQTQDQNRTPRHTENRQTMSRLETPNAKDIGSRLEADAWDGDETCRGVKGSESTTPNLCTASL